MKRGKVLSLILTTVIATSAVLTGCKPSESKSTSGKKDGEKITLSFFNKSEADKRGATKDVWMWKKYEEKTGIHIDWKEIPRDAVDDKKGIALASNELPDAFFEVDFSADDLAKYGKQGTFVALDTLIDKNAPNLKKLLETNPLVKKAITMPDGHIYSLPIIETASFYGNYYINKKWLDKLGLKVPATLDELYNVLVAFKEQDPNDNGKKDEIPYYVFGKGIGELDKQIGGSFGVGNRGSKGIKYLIDEDPAGTVRFMPFASGYKESWQYISKMWTSGLLSPEFFSGVDEKKWNTDLAADKIGMVSWVSPGILGDKAKDFVGISAFKGPHGDQIMSSCSIGMGISKFVMTKANKHPEETMKWIDYFYGEEGSKFATLGLEGETYTVKDGKKRYIDDIMNFKDGPQMGAFKYMDGANGGNMPMLSIPYEEWCEVRGVDAKTDLGMDSEAWKQYAPKERWAEFIPTTEEAAEIKPLWNDINNYITEQRVQFITGKRSFDKDWDDFIKTLEKMGAKRYLEIKQKQFDRYKKF